MRKTNKKSYVIGLGALALAGCANMTPPPTQPQTLNSVQFDSPPALQLTTADGAHYAATFKIYGWVTQGDHGGYLMPKQLKHAQPYLVGFNDGVFNLDFQLVPLDRVTSVQKAGRKVRFTLDNGAAAEWPSVYLAACPSGLANPKLSDCLFPAYNAGIDAELNPFDGSAAKRQHFGRYDMWMAGQWSALPAGKLESLLASRRAAAQKAAAQQRRDKESADAQQRRAAHAVQARYNAILRRMDAHGKAPSAVLLKHIGQAVYGFATASDNPCVVKTNPLPWQDGPWLNLARLDNAGVGHIVESRDRVAEAYSDTDAVRVKYTAFAGNGVNFSFSTLDEAHRGVGMLRDLSRRCRAIGQ